MLSTFSNQFNEYSSSILTNGNAKNPKDFVTQQCLNQFYDLGRRQMHIPQYLLLPDLPTLQQSIWLHCQAGGCRKCQLTQQRYVQLKLMISKVKHNYNRPEKGMWPLTWTAYLVFTFQSKFLTSQLIFKRTPSLKVFSISRLCLSKYNDTV